MGRKSKEILYQEKRNAERSKCIELLHDHFPTIVIDEIYDTIGYSQCTSCEILSIHCNECQVCDELFCEDCGPEHSTEETGF
jgi:hypothetical protein